MARSRRDCVDLVAQSLVASSSGNLGDIGELDDVAGTLWDGCFPHAYFKGGIFEALSCQPENVQTVDWSHLGLPFLPTEFVGQLTNAHRVDLGNNRLQSLPVEMTDMVALRELDARHNEIAAIPVALLLGLEANGLEQMDLGGNPAAVRLSFAESNVTDDNFPGLVFVFGEGLEFFNLSGNSLTSLPDGFSALANIQVLDVSSNFLEEFPAVLASCKNLVSLFLSQNPKELRADSVFSIDLKSNSSWEQMKSIDLSSVPLRRYPADLLNACPFVTNVNARDTGVTAFEMSPRFFFNEHCGTVLMSGGIERDVKIAPHTTFCDHFWYSGIHQPDFKTEDAIARGEMEDFWWTGSCLATGDISIRFCMAPEATNCLCLSFANASVCSDADLMAGRCGPSDALRLAECRNSGECAEGEYCDAFANCRPIEEHPWYDDRSTGEKAFVVLHSGFTMPHFMCTLYAALSVCIICMCAMTHCMGSMTH
jgi:hypothetical protein